MSIPGSEHVTDSVERFAADLRELRLSAGDPKLLALSERTGVSKSVLSEAFSGRRLPTERTVARVVEDLGGDRDAWVSRRTALDPRGATQPAETLPVAEAAQQARRFSLAQTLLIAAATAVLAVGGTSLFWLNTQSPLAEVGAPENAEGPYLAAANGVDPMRTACKDDAIIAASESRLDRQVHVQLLYSNDCMAVWGRVTRYDDRSSGNTLTMQIYPEGERASARAQERTAEGLQSMYTPMIVEPDVEARICGAASLTLDGETIDLGPELCA